MKYPCLVLKSVCTTPITITVYQEGLSEDGEPLKALEINALCNYQDKAKTVLTADKQLVQLSALILSVILLLNWQRFQTVRSL